MIELRLFGGFRLSADDGRPVVTLAQRPRRAALLAWLAAAAPDTLQRRDKALALFWPDLDERRARAALSQSLYVLRAALGEDAIITRGHEEIGIDRAVVWCDVAAFEAALAAGRPADALALYTGDLLDGFHVAGASGFEWWLDDARAQFRARAADAAWSLADAAAEARDAADSKRWGSRAAALQPADDAAVRRLMTLLHRVGDRSAAIRTYDAFARSLACEYELEPAAETQALVRALRDAVEDPAAVHVDLAGESNVAGRAPRARTTAAAALLTAVTMLAIPVLLALRDESTLPRSVVRFSLEYPVSPGHAGPTLAFAPAGDRLVYVGSDAGGNGLYLRGMNALDAAPIPNTRGASVPFFSPDGAWLGFATGSRIRRVRLDGGAAVDVIDTNHRVRGASWTEAGDIVFANPAGLWRVPAAGGHAELVVASNGTDGYAWPAALPGGTHVVVTRLDSAAFRLVAVSLDDGTVTDLHAEGTNPHFVAPRTLLFARRDGGLYAAGFDPHTRRLERTIRQVTDGITVGITGAAKLGVSQTGSIAYVPDAQNRVLVAVDRSGRETPLPIAPSGFTNARLSPDGRSLATTMGPTPGRTDVWVIELASSRMLRLTFDSTSLTPVWSADGDALFIARHAGAGRGFELLRIPVARPDSASSLLAPSRGQLPAAVTPDGRALIFHRIDARTRGDIWMLELNGRNEPAAILASPADERGAALSPAGDRLAYVSTESGIDEVYVQPFPGPGEVVQISSGGGSEPRWDAAGSTIFYRGEHGMTAARMSRSPLRVESRTLLFDETDYIDSPVHAIYDVLPDGQRFFMVRRAEDNRELIIVLNAIEPGR